MDFLECVKGRRSIRKYKTDAVSDETLKNIVSAASFAPSWKNTQTTRYIIIRDKAKINELAERCVMNFEPNMVTIMNAPAIILVTTITSRSGFERDGSFSTGKGTHWESFDAGIATQTLCLTAYNEGMGTVIMGIYDEAEVAKVVVIPDGQKLSAIVAIGYPQEESVMPKRKDIGDLITLY